MTLSREDLVENKNTNVNQPISEIYSQGAPEGTLLLMNFKSDFLSLEEQEDEYDETIETERPYDPSSYLSPKNMNLPQKKMNLPQKSMKLAEVISERTKTPDKEERNQI